MYSLLRHNLKKSKSRYLETLSWFMYKEFSPGKHRKCTSRLFKSRVALIVIPVRYVVYTTC